MLEDGGFMEDSAAAASLRAEVAGQIFTEKETLKP